MVGFFKITMVTGHMDWGLIGALAATAGSGGIGKLYYSLLIPYTILAIFGVRLGDPHPSP